MSLDRGLSTAEKKLYVELFIKLLCNTIKDDNIFIIFTLTVGKLFNMEVPINIGFDQLVNIIKMLPKKQLEKLLLEIQNEKDSQQSSNNLEELLLSGPVATKKELEVIENNRKSINEWGKI